MLKFQSLMKDIKEVLEKSIRMCGLNREKYKGQKKNIPIVQG